LHEITKTNQQTENFQDSDLEEILKMSQQVIKQKTEQTFLSMLTQKIKNS